jgi:hypothetical protein
MDEALARTVRRRADDRCEYCRMPQALYSTVTFPIDHIVAQQHGGPTRLSNLALSCLHCNSHKGTNLTGIDPHSRRVTRLFHPRRHKWTRHFVWDGPVVVGQTPVGRATVAVLVMNHPDVLEVRRELIAEGRFPPVG